MKLDELIKFHHRLCFTCENANYPQNCFGCKILKRTIAKVKQWAIGELPEKLIINACADYEDIAEKAGFDQCKRRAIQNINKAN